MHGCIYVHVGVCVLLTLNIRTVVSLDVVNSFLESASACSLKNYAFSVLCVFHLKSVDGDYKV